MCQHHFLGPLHRGDVEAGVPVLVDGVVICAVQYELLDAVIVLVLGRQVQSCGRARMRHWN